MLALSKVAEQHKHQLLLQQKRHAAVLVEVVKQQAQQLQDPDLRHFQAMAQVKQQHEQDIAQLQLQLHHRATFQQTDARSASLIEQQQVEREEGPAQHGSKVGQVMQKCACTQKDAMECTQAGTKAQLTQQQSPCTQALECCIALSKLLEQQQISPIAPHESQMQALEVVRSPVLETYLAQLI